MKFSLLCLLLILLISGCSQPPEQPLARIAPDTTLIWGQQLVDDYAWLKDRNRSNPEVLAYIAAENKFTSEILKPTRKLQKKIYREIVARFPENELSVPVRIDDYFYYVRRVSGKKYNLYCRKQTSRGATEEVYLDENELVRDNTYLHILTRQISPNHRYLAYSVDLTGSENYTLFIKDLESGSLLADSIHGVGEVVWANDNKTIFYNIEDESGRTYQVYRHRLGEDPAGDELLYTESDGGFYVWLSKSRSRRFILLGSESKTTSEIRFLDAADPAGEFQLVQPRQHNLTYDVQDWFDLFYITTNADGAHNNKIMTTPIARPGKENWREFLPPSDSTFIFCSVFEKFLLISELQKGIRNLVIMDHHTSESRAIEFPEEYYLALPGENPDFHTDKFRYNYESLLTPPSILECDIRTGVSELLKRQEVRGYIQSEYASERIWVPARDGLTSIPVSLVYRRDLRQPRQANLLLLDGYGSYGDLNDPYFSYSRISLLDRGFIYAIAHVRGGGELGKTWHDQGRMMNKKNTFTDFIDCADYLVAEGYTSRDKLAIQGGSAGGLLVGAVLNERPDICHAAIADVPFVDIINTMLDPTLSAVVSEYEEWGNPHVREEFDYILSYSPYENVRAQDYPHILVIGGFQDTRVNYWEPAKWTAQLRATKTDDNLLLLRIDMNAGHGGASGRFDIFREIAMKSAFLSLVFAEQ